MLRRAKYYHTGKLLVSLRHEKSQKKKQQELNDKDIYYWLCETVTRQECSAKVCKVARKERELLYRGYISGAEGLGWSRRRSRFSFPRKSEWPRERKKSPRCRKCRAAAIKKINEVVPFRRASRSRLRIDPAVTLLDRRPIPTIFSAGLQCTCVALKCIHRFCRTAKHTLFVRTLTLVSRPMPRITPSVYRPSRCK